MLQMREATANPSTGSFADYARQALGGRSSWLRLGLVDKAPAPYPLPVTHVVPRQRTVDFAAAPARAT